MDENRLECEVCGRPGEPSWAGAILCEDCYGTIGATCSGIRRSPDPRSPISKSESSESEGVC